MATLLILATVVVFCYSISLFWPSRSPHLSPGPPRLPLIGNLHQHPRKEPWKTYEQWHKLYGPIFSLKLGQHTVIVLGNNRVAKDLLDKRSNIYSSRPHMVVVERLTKGLQMGVLPYGEKWRVHRRIQASFLNKQVSALYHDVQDIESKQLTYEISRVKNFSDCFHRFGSSLIFALSYGKRIVKGDEREAQEIDQLSKNIAEVLAPGSWLVEAFPIMDYLPRCLAPWKQVGDEFHQRELGLFSDNATSGLQSHAWNWMKEAAKREEAQKLPEEELFYLIGGLYEAGSHTTTAVLEVFAMASILHPEAVRRAQTEIDTAVGQDRLPTFKDIPHLPYTIAFIKEVLRWRPVVPLAVPHAVDRDDEYMGYLIPKGATVIANVWSMNLDGEVFQDADDFQPERWMQDPGLPVNAFGFGRRVCVGQYLAMKSLNIAISRLLWAYDVDHDRDQHGSSVADASRMEQAGVTARPAHFGAIFRFRSLDRQSIVAKERDGAVEDIDTILDRIKQNFPLRTRIL